MPLKDTFRLRWIPFAYVSPVIPYYFGEIYYVPIRSRQPLAVSRNNVPRSYVPTRLRQPSRQFVIAMCRDIKFLHASRTVYNFTKIVSLMSYVRMRLGRPSRMVGGLSKNVIPADGQRHNHYLVPRSLSPPLLLCISLYPSLPLSLSRALTFCIPLSSLHPSLPLSLSLSSLGIGVCSRCAYVPYTFGYVWRRPPPLRTTHPAAD